MKTKTIATPQPPKSEEQMILTWMGALKITLRNKSQQQKRLEELKSWDTCNGHDDERKIKIKALERLIAGRG